VPFWKTRQNNRETNILIKNKKNNTKYNNNIKFLDDITAIN